MIKTVRSRLFAFIFILILAACAAMPPTTAAAPTFTEAPTPTATAEYTVTPAPTLTETLVPLSLPVLESPQLASMDMLDSRRGWGIAAGGGTGAIVRTQD